MIAMIGGNPAASGSKATQYTATRCGHNAETWKPSEPVIGVCSICSSMAAQACSTHHQHRNAGVVQDLLRLTTQHQLRDAVPAMRCHHDQVATGTSCCSDDRLMGFFGPFRERVVPDPGEIGLALQWREQLVRVGLRKHLQLRRRRFKQFLDDARVVELRHCMEARHPGTDLLCKCDALFDRTARTRIVIDWNEDVREHVCLPWAAPLPWCTARILRGSGIKPRSWFRPPRCERLVRAMPPDV